MGITENASYLKGLFEGYEIDTDKKEGKILSKLLDLVSEMAEKIKVLEAENNELREYVIELGEDLTALEDDFYEDSDDEYDDYDDLNDDEEYDEEMDDYYEIQCPSCGEKVCFTDDIDIEELICPACGEKVGDVELCDGDCSACEGCEE